MKDTEAINKILEILNEDFTCSAKVRILQFVISSLKDEGEITINKLDETLKDLKTELHHLHQKESER